MTENVVGNFESVMSKIGNRRAAKKEEARIALEMCDEMALLRSKLNATKDPFEARDIRRKLNLMKNLAGARVQCDFKLLDDQGPEYKPENESQYDSAISMRANKDVGVVIAHKLGIKERDVDLMLQYAVRVGDLSIEEYYDRQPTNCSAEDIAEIRRMTTLGYQTGEIVVAMYLRGVRVSKEIIAHPENYI